MIFDLEVNCPFKGCLFRKVVLQVALIMTDESSEAHTQGGLCCDIDFCIKKVSAVLYDQF